MRTLARSTWFARLALTLAFAAAGCELLVSDPMAVVRCDAEGTVGPPACQEGFVCRGGTCVDETAIHDHYELCQDDRACASGMCVTLSDGIARCVPRCCASSACAPLEQARVACVEVEHGGLIERACAGILPVTAEAPLGAACSAHPECTSGFCEGGRCSERCCTDQDCWAAGGTACVPEPLDSGWALRCSPK